MPTRGRQIFESTTPFGQPELMRASGYQHYLDQLEAEARERGVNARIASLSPSVRADLYRFEAEGRPSDVLEVIAACVRHVQRLTVHLQFNEKVAPLSVFPGERLVHSLVPPEQLVGSADLKVMHVEPAVLQPPGEGPRELTGEPTDYRPLAPFLWGLALHGTRHELLPEIVGPAGYRVAPGLETGHLPMTAPLEVAVQRLRAGTQTLREIAEGPGLDRESAGRLLNALYLQAGLMVSRSHPEALGQGWFGRRE